MNISVGSDPFTQPVTQMTVGDQVVTSIPGTSTGPLITITPVIKNTKTSKLKRLLQEVKEKLTK